ncbi:MAG: hypothetical protein VYB17_01835, partial [Candidatus Thermoplasmatota archaeon]|nr:hypothetical protein [Candidatus Thermoplasmatota archaeon]
MPMPLQPPAIEDPVVLARYPFLPQANPAIKAHMEANDVNLESLIDTDWLDAVRVRARVRLLESVVSKDIDVSTSVDIHTPYGQMVECLSFLYAMVTVCASNDERLLGRWAEGESSRADTLWGRIEQPESFQRLAETYLSDIRMGEDGNWEVPMIDFIEICPKISGSYWQLPNRPVHNGWVTLSPASGENSQERLARLLKERIRVQLMEECRSRMALMDDEFVGRMAEEVGRIEQPESFQRLAETYLSDIRMGDDGNWEVPLIDFIEICPKISGSYWRLPNRPVQNGWVTLSPSSSENSQERLARLLKERIRVQLIEECR